MQSLVKDAYQISLWYFAEEQGVILGVIKDHIGQLGKVNDQYLIYPMNYRVQYRMKSKDLLDEYPDADRINYCGVIDPSVDSEVPLCRRKCEIPDIDKPNENFRYLEIRIVPEPEDSDERLNFEWLWKDNGIICHAEVWRSYRYAIGSFLFKSEQHWLDPWEELVNLQSHENKNLASKTRSYAEWLSDLTRKDRLRLWKKLTKARIIDLQDHHSDPRILQWTKAVNQGQFMRAASDKFDFNSASQCLADIHTDPRSCYYTTLEAYGALAEEGFEVTYCEGIALPEQGAPPIEHAWLQLDGKVLEATWPTHFPTGGEGVYYGVPIDNETLKKRRKSRPPTTTMLLDKDEYQARLEIISQGQQSPSLRASTKGF